MLPHCWDFTNRKRNDSPILSLNCLTFPSKINIFTGYKSFERHADIPGILSNVFYRNWGTKEKESFMLQCSDLGIKTRKYSIL